jgi:hypothetical protein
MAASRTAVAAGGQQGQLDVRAAADGAPLLRAPGTGSVVNALHLAPGAGAVGGERLFVASNDCRVRAFDLPPAAGRGGDADGGLEPENVPPPGRDGDDEPGNGADGPQPGGRQASAAAARAARERARAPAATVRALDPVNYCALAPSAATLAPRALACVGDCAAVSVHVPREGGASFAPPSTWDAFDDAGMGVAWSPGGSWLVAGAQCGAAVAVDPRSRALAARLPACRGPVRAVKVCPGPADLVLIAEHADVAHLVDARTWRGVQTLRVGAAPLSGAAFSPDGARAYVGLEDGGVAVYGVATAERCCVAEWGAR